MKVFLFVLLILSAWLALVCAEDLSGPHTSDQQVIHQVHSAIVADDTLPYCAHVVKVHSENGKVILKGRVHTEEQKEKVNEKAAGIAGDENVINKVTVTPS